jgi:cbb3-type cytochrome oxidase subunit 3
MLLAIPTQIVILIALLLLIMLGLVASIFYAATKKNIEKENEANQAAQDRLKES